MIGEDSDFRDEVDRYSLDYLSGLFRETMAEAGGTCADTDYVGCCAEIVSIRSRITSLVRTRAPVLLIGERGTGKGQLVRAIGAHTGKEPLTLALASLPEGIADAELFGHTKGAFTGAETQRTGIILAAQRARRLLFLDDVAECSPAVQAKLLAVLDCRTVHGGFSAGTIGRATSGNLPMSFRVRRSRLASVVPSMRRSCHRPWLPRRDWPKRTRLGSRQRAVQSRHLIGRLLTRTVFRRCPKCETAIFGGHWIALTAT